MAAVLELSPDTVESLSMGKCWAALLDDQVVGFITTNTPRSKNVNFEEYREKARTCLAMLGDVMTGELVRHESKLYVAKRLTHKNRGNSPRNQKLYHLAPWVLSGFEPRQEPYKI